MKVDSAQLLATFRRYLSDHSLPATHQRLAIADALFTAADHVSADDLATLVAKQGVAVGTATVYRTLDLLVKSGLVREHDFGEGFKRYEPLARHTSIASASRAARSWSSPTSAWSA